MFLPHCETQSFTPIQNNSQNSTDVSVGRDEVLGIGTRYELNGPGIESRWGGDLPRPSRPALSPTQPPIQWVPGIFTGGKAAGAWR